MRQLNGKALYYAFVSGAYEVVQKRDVLNRINVFPIADGDTGSNLVFTMRSIVDDATVFDSAKHTMNSIADAALIGARGNSGIIFAQFIRGINTGIGDVEDITVRDFSEAVKNAIPYAYEAVSDPTEGTILTVMRDWADSLVSLYDHAKDFDDLFAQSMEAAVKSLRDTPNKLRVLKRASVVDSGAKGFVHFLQGFQRFIESGKSMEVVFEQLPIELEADQDFVLTATKIPFRYCTEALISGEELAPQAIKKQLADLGDSLIVAGGGNKVRIHMHTNDPQTLMLRLRGFGEILQQKVDDMKRQSDVIHRRKGNIALVTDSIADIPQALIDKQQIHVIALNIMMEGSAYLDRLTMTSDTIYELLDAMPDYPTSSQPNGKTVEAIFSFLVHHYESIIVISVAKELSGTFATVTRAAEKFVKEGTLITVIDSKLNSGAQGLLVTRAAEAISAGHDHESVVAIVNETIGKSKIFVSVHTLKYMLRSGRVSSSMAFAAKLLNLKPVVSLDENGKGSIFGKAFSAKGNTKVIYRSVKAAMAASGIQEYCIVHASAPDRAAEYERLFTELTGKGPKYIMEISAITALSAGVGSTGIAMITD